MKSPNAWLAGLAACLLAAPTLARAQAVEVAPLTAPSAFSAPARDTGLPPTLWSGTSASTFRTALALVVDKPLSPAARALADRLLATAAAPPAGGGEEADLVALRLRGLTALGDLEGARAVLTRTPNPERSPVLAQAVAEIALLSGEDDRACQVGDSVASGRDAIYWLRLRAYCLARAGQGGPAQLTLDLAQEKSRDAAFGRLMAARLAGAGDPGAPSLRNGLDLALSRSLGLDLSQAKAAPAVSAALSGGRPPSSAWPFAPADSPVSRTLATLARGDLSGAEQSRAALTQDVIPGATADDLALLDAALAVARGKSDAPTLDRLIERGDAGEAKLRPARQGASLILAALGWPIDDEARGALARFPPADTRAGSTRLLAMDLAADARLAGETALLAITLSAEAGPSGPVVADRARIVRALRVVGLEDEARAFALEGLIGLR